MTSCDLFTSKDKKTQEMINKELLEIDWNDVDNYPLFENCDETLTKTGQRECFENELLAHLTSTLNDFEFVFDSEIDPTVQVDFLVDKDGRISISAIVKDPEIDRQMPEFDSIIGQGLKNISTLAPALKRGIPVKAKFRIPILLKSNEL